MSDNIIEKQFVSIMFVFCVVVLIANLLNKSRGNLVVFFVNAIKVMAKATLRL